MMIQPCLVMAGGRTGCTALSRLRIALSDIATSRFYGQPRKETTQMSDPFDQVVRRRWSALSALGGQFAS
jgi:hypothetical protein